MPVVPATGTFVTAMAMYPAPWNFREHHRRLGETCDYASMKQDMVAAVTDGASSSWFDVGLSWLEWTDFDLSSVFDFLS